MHKLGRIGNLLYWVIKHFSEYGLRKLFFFKLLLYLDIENNTLYTILYELFLYFIQFDLLTT